MKLDILAFGIARDIVGGAVFSLDLVEGARVADLKNLLLDRFPAFTSLASLQIAVNAEFAADALDLHPRDEIALIPPVSGG